MPGNALWLAKVASFLAVSLEVAHAQPRCGASATVDLTIELEPPEASARKQLHQLHQRLEAELRLRELAACPVPAGQRRRAHVYVLAPVPDLSPTFIRVYTEHARLERKLDVAALPAEARPSAIASAADTLLSTLLESTLASPAAPADGVPVATREPEAPPVEPKLPWSLPELELGLAGGGALYGQGGKAYGAEVLARWRPRPLLWAALSLGADRGSAPVPAVHALAAPVARGRDLSRAWHVGLDAGVDLPGPVQGLWLAANLGLALARVHRTAELEFSTAEGPDLQRARFGSSWELAPSIGGEVGYRTGPWGITLALALLVPLTPPEPKREPVEPTEAPSPQSQRQDTWNDVKLDAVGFGEQPGGQLDLRLWFALGT